MKTTKPNTATPLLFLLGILLLLNTNLSFSQTEISGHVFSAKDSTAIYGGSVYFDGTSIGASTNEAGYFDISFKKNNSPLIISSMGYESVIINSEAIQTSKKLANIYLAEKTENLETIYIEIDTLSRSKKMELFKHEFLGKDKAAQLCEIINESAIKLRYIPSTKTLIASSNEPIIIKNNYLGYMLVYNLRDFQVTFKTLYRTLIPESLSYHGFSFFKPLEDKTPRQILRNRKRSYLGSTLHFMRSLYSQKIDTNGFSIIYNKMEVPSYTYFDITNIGNIKRVKILVNKIIIQYTSFKAHELSTLFSKGEFTIDYTGYHSPPKSINLRGEMSTRRISEQLPLGYKP